MSMPDHSDAPMNIAVLGAGAWGTGMALHLARRHVVHLWSREADVAATMQETGINERYLPGVRLPESVVVHAGTAQTQDVFSPANRTFIVYHSLVSTLFTGVYRMVDRAVPNLLIIHNLYNLKDGGNILLRFAVQLHICDMSPSGEGMKRGLFLYLFKD